MTNTVVALFKDSSHAQNAVHQLANTGISRDHIDIAFPYDQTNSSSSPAQEEEGFFHKIGRFFSLLFEEQTLAEKYAELGRRHTIVTVHAQTDEAAVAAAQILDDHGAMDADTPVSDKQNVQVSDRSLPISDDKLDDNTGIGMSGIRTRSRIFKRPVEKDFRIFSMDQYEDDLSRTSRIRNRNY